MKNDILTFQEKEISHIENRTNIILEIYPLEIEIEEWWLNAANTWMKEIIETILSDIGENFMLKIMIGE